MARRAESRVRWFLVFGLFILSAVAYLDRVNISIAGSSIAAEYHLSNVQLGWIFSAFLVGYALFQTPGGWLADRLGPRRVLAAGVLWWGIFTALTALVSTKIAFTVLLFAAVRFLLGAGEAIIYPASNQFVSRWIPSAERGIANGLIFAGVGVGAGVTPVLITQVIIRYGWRWSFWMSAVIGLIAGTAWYFAPAGNAEWHFLNAQTEKMDHLLFGDFDGDGRTDVFTQRGRDWFVSWGGASRWETINGSGRALGNFAVGNFVGDRRDDIFYADGSHWYASDAVPANSSRSTSPPHAWRTSVSAISTRTGKPTCSAS